MDQPTIKYRNMLVQILLMMVTFGLYTFYWFYVTSKEMKSLATDSDISPALLTVLLFIPFISLYSYYKHAELFQEISSEHMPKWVLFILWLFFPPGVWFLVQMELNERASRQVSPVNPH